jgi:hypothetical protein
MRRVMLGLLLVATGLVSGCREKSNFKPIIDGGLVCGTSERIVNGECVFVCDRDGDCPTGQQCNLLTGSCQPNVAGIAPSEPAFPCTEGAERCSADARGIEVCGAEGKWTTTESCPPPEGYCLNERCLQCRPGSARCDGASTTSLLVCKDDGSGTATVTCEGGASCVSGECRACTPGAQRCSPDGATAQICKKLQRPGLAWGWENAGDAFDGSCITRICEQLSGTSARCKAPDCFPGTTRCKDSATQQICSDRGIYAETTCRSIPGHSEISECMNGACVDECAEAARANSYFGCEYWSAVLDNAMLPFFKGDGVNGQGTTDSEFAFVVANRSLLPTTVEVWRHRSGVPVRVKTVVVPGREDAVTKGLATIQVPWQSIGNDPGTLAASGLMRYGYRLTATRPVSVYQFNPLDAARATNTSCSAPEGTPDSWACNEAGGCDFFDSSLCGICRAKNGRKVCHYNTYSNDASLLLPAHILGTSYVALTPEFVAFSPGDTSAPTDLMNPYITVVAPQDGTTVTVKLSARTRSGRSVTAGNRGDTQTFTLNSYDVLQIAADANGTAYLGRCEADPFSAGGLFPSGRRVCRVDSDLTGTVISSTKPVALFAGAACHLRPYTAAACDHVEEQIFPFNTWGKTFVAVKSHPLRLTSGGFASAGNAAADYYKLVASCPPSQCPAGTLLKLSTPPAASDVLPPGRCLTGSLPTNDCRLEGSATIEFRSKANFTLTADNPIAVAQLFAGQQATGGLITATQGDPSMILLPPVEQWRANYTLLAAPGTADNYLGLSIDETQVASVKVDGQVVSGWVSVPGSSYKTLNHPVTNGAHTVVVEPKAGIQSTPGAGVTVYGFDSYVSYGYTGGLDLGTIVTGINPGG